jgi:hypothetical protein
MKDKMMHVLDLVIKTPKNINKKRNVFTFLLVTEKIMANGIEKSIKPEMASGLRVYAVRISLLKIPPAEVDMYEEIIRALYHAAISTGSLKNIRFCPGASWLNSREAMKA